MITYVEASLDKISIHKIGNQAQSEPCHFSNAEVTLDDELVNQFLKQFFLNPFEKSVETYQFYHSSDNLELNEMYHFATTVFDDPTSFHETSIQIAKHLYEVSSHPKIKSGELYVGYFKQLQIDGELLDAIGLFKSETKETYLKVYPQQSNFQVSYEQEAINIKKLDKGCIIFNTNKEEGFKIAVIDQTNKSTEALYWVDEFLRLKVRNDNFSQTKNTLGIYKNFVTQQMESEFAVSKTDQIDLLNRSMKYFKEKDEFDLDEFAREVIDNTQAIESFKTYKSNYEEEFDTVVPDSFAISNTAVKKQARVFKSVLKLDKNFHIYIHGNTELIEQGVDEKGRKFYKIFYDNEM
ncbi:nucleoid-associated protein [Parasediminibacterium sp. JCM 36343]|uniref:nucleoid-associated protein n=1 Tax=Parasediminibacterium sp. JCM 36343 TaxID=3374279 RepID=UPI0039797DFC